MKPLSEIRDDTAYHYGGDLVDFWVERYGDALFVDEVDWIKDVCEISVS